ncbi:MAG: DUF4340 domain-containing protein [Ruminococcus sp.]
MKKAAKGIIGLAAVLAVLGGGVAALRLTEPDELQESSAESSEVYGAGRVILEDGDIESVKLKNTSGEMNIILDSSNSTDTAAVYTIEGYEDIPLVTASVSAAVNGAKGLTSAAVASDDCNELEKYGLSSPEITAEYHYASGKTVTLSIGDKVPTASNYYVKTSENNTVYTVSSGSLTNYSKSVEEFVSSTILEEPAEEDYPIISSLRIEREDMDSDIYLEYNEHSDDKYWGGSSAAHIMVEPVDAFLSVERSESITNGLFGLTSKGVYSIHPGESEIAEAGLAEPFCRVTMKCDDGSSYVFIMSEPYVDENGKKLHYAMFEGGNIIYIVSADDAQWGTVKLIDITSKIFVGSNVWCISELKIGGRDVVDSDIVISPSDAVTDMDSRSSKTMNATRNGAEIDSERYRSYYSLLINLPAEEFALDAEIPSTEPILTLNITDSYKNTVTDIRFYDYSSMSALVVVDGKSKYLCNKSQIEMMADNANRFETGEDFVTTWK